MLRACQWETGHVQLELLFCGLPILWPSIGFTRDNFTIIFSRSCKLALSDCCWQLHAQVGCFAPLLLGIPIDALAWSWVVQTICWICGHFNGSLGFGKAKSQVFCGQQSTFEAKWNLLWQRRPQNVFQTMQSWWFCMQQFCSVWHKRGSLQRHLDEPLSQITFAFGSFQSSWCLFANCSTPKACSC